MLGQHGRYLAGRQMRRFLATASITSQILLAIFLVVFLLGFVVSPSKHFLSMTDSIHVGVWNRGFDSRIVVFNDAQNGPYRGSINGLVGDDGEVYPKIVHQRAFGDAYGVYYRFIQRADSADWTFMVSIWYPIAMFAIIPILTSFGHKRFSKAKAAK